MQNITLGEHQLSNSIFSYKVKANFQTATDDFLIFTLSYNINCCHVDLSSCSSDRLSVEEAGTLGLNKQNVTKNKFGLKITIARDSDRGQVEQC